MLLQYLNEVNEFVPAANIMGYVFNTGDEVGEVFGTAGFLGGCFGVAAEWGEGDALGFAFVPPVHGAFAEGQFVILFEVGVDLGDGGVGSEFLEGFAGYVAFVFAFDFLGGDWHDISR